MCADKNPLTDSIRMNCAFHTHRRRGSQFWPVFARFRFSSHTHSDTRNRILQFHLLKECSSNHTRRQKKASKRQTEEWMTQKLFRALRRFTGNLVDDSRVLLSLKFIESSYFIHKRSLLIRSKSWFIREEIVRRQHSFIELSIHTPAYQLSNDIILCTHKVSFYSEL